MTRPVVSVRLPRDSPAAAYALTVLLDLLGLEQRPATRDADLVYGDGDGRCRIPAGPARGWDDPRPQVSEDEGLPLIHLPGGPARRRSGPAALGFDTLYATYALLTGPWEVADPADVVGCPIAADGWLARSGLLGEPLVHRYAEAIREALSEAQVPSAPRRRPTIVLTHDVDDNFRHLFGVRERYWRLRRDVAARRRTAVRRAAGLVREVARRGPDPNDRFADWCAWHRRWRSRPTFFVASFGLFREGADDLDVAYDVRHAAVSALLRRVREDGAEIGIHFSLGAKTSVERLRLERESLEQVVGAPVRVARHHWWALGVPPERTLALHGEAGIAVDCSLGFNDRAGFRRGIAAPFRPLDPARNGPADVLALPTAAMDAALFGGGRPAAEGLAELRSLYRRVKDVGGALVLDWHVHSANPATIPHAAATLRTFVDEAVADGASLRTPLELVSEASG